MALNNEQQEGLVTRGYRSRIWTLFHLNPNHFFSVEEISEITGLKTSTVRQGLKFIKRLPLIERREKYEIDAKVVTYGFVPIHKRRLRET